jgi:hypothetical protein
MSRLIKDYIEIGDHASLDDLIARLTALRASLPADSEAELKIRGDDVFGRHLCIGFLRPLTPEEAACEGRYAEAGRARLKRAA